MPRFQLQKDNSPGHRMAAGNATHLPIYNPVPGEVFRSRSMENRVHFIPIIVFVCIFILWVASSSTQVDTIIIKDGNFNSLDEIEKPKRIHETRVDLTMLASVATPLNASAPQQLIPERREIKPQPGDRD